jgi:hypothetical protein
MKFLKKGSSILELAVTSEKVAYCFGTHYNYGTQLSMPAKINIGKQGPKWKKMEC